MLAIEVSSGVMTAKFKWKMPHFFICSHSSFSSGFWMSDRTLQKTFFLACVIANGVLIGCLSLPRPVVSVEEQSPDQGGLQYWLLQFFPLCESPLQRCVNSWLEAELGRGWTLISPRRDAPSPLGFGTLASAVGRSLPLGSLLGGQQHSDHTHTR